MLEAVDVGADDVEAAAPELGGSQVDAKPASKLGSVGAAGPGQELVVAGAEPVRIDAVAGVEAEAEQEPEEVREVVEREPRSVIVPLDRSHVGMEEVRVEAVAVGRALGVEHEPA